MSVSSTPPSLSPRFSLSLSRPPTPREEVEGSIEVICQNFIDTLRFHGITCVVFDLDLTLSSRHSQGALEASTLTEYCASLTSTSKILLPLLIQSGLTIAIATFSDELYTSSNSIFPYYAREAYVSGRSLVQAILRPILSASMLSSISIICLNPDLYRTSTPTASRVMPALPSRIRRILTEREVSREVSSLSQREVSSTSRSRKSDWFSSFCCCLTIEEGEVTSSSFVTPVTLPISTTYQPPPLRTIPNHSNHQSNNTSNHPMNNNQTNPLQTHQTRPSLSIPVPTPSPSSRSISHSIPPAINPSVNQSVSHSINQSNTIRDSEGLVVTVNDVSMILEGDNEMELGMYQMQASPSKRNPQQSVNLSVNNPSCNPTALSPSTSPVLSNPLSVNARTNNNNANQFAQYSPRHHLSHRSLSGHVNNSKQNIMHSPSQQIPSVSPLNMQPQHYPRAGSPLASTRPLPLAPLQVPSAGTFTSPSTPSSPSINPSLSTSRPIKPATPKTVPNSKMSKHFFPTTPKLMLTSRHSPAQVAQPPPAHNHGTLTQPLPPFAQLVATTALAAPHSINQPGSYNLSHTPSASQSILNIDKPLDQSSKHAFFINKLHALGLNQFHSMWSTVSAYPPPSYKTAHLHCIRALHALAMHQILLIDDMEENVNAAVAGGCYAIHVSGQAGLRAGHLQPERIITPFSRD